MALNPNIILQGKTPTFEAPDPIAQYSKGLQLKGLMTQQNLQDQAMADDQATRAAYQSSGGDSNATLKSLISGGQYKAAQALQKQIADQAKTQAETSYKTAQTGQANAATQKTQQDIKFEAATNHAKNLNLIQTPQDAVKYVDDGISSGVFPAQGRDAMLQNIAAAPSLSGWVAQQKLAAIPVLEKFKQDAENSRNAATNLTSIQNNQNTNATTQRGQNMTDARSRMTAEQGNVPSGYRRTSDGNLEAIPGGPAMNNKPLTDSQAKSAGFGARMQAADQTLNDLAAQGTSVSVPGSHSSYGVGTVINALSPAKQQNLDQAKRDFINAILRRESGAAISQGEFDNAEKQYFPQVGDKPDVIAQKAKNRAISTRGVLSEVPGNQREDTVSSIIGNGGTASNVRQKIFSSLPDPASLNGKRIQAPDGNIMRSNGSKWIQEK